MRVEPAFGPEIGARHGGSSIDGRIAALAGRQHGVVARRQLVGLGLGRRAIAHRVEQGRLHPVHRGVYAVGHRALSLRGVWLAAVLSGGSDAVLSHVSAAALWGIRDTAATRVSVTAPRVLRSRRGVRFHEGEPAPDELTAVDGIPVTTPPRTLLDLAAVLAPRQVERALNQAEVLRLTDALSVADLLARHPRRRGVATLRRILDSGLAGAAVTRSELEERFLAFLDRFGIPRPEVNVRLEAGGRWIEVDCVWRGRRLVVELDGYATHAARAAFERDRARDRALQAAGWRVIRITWRQLHEDPRALAAELRALGI